MKKNLLFVTFVILSFSSGFCQSLYSDTAQTGNRFNPGLGVSGTPIIVFDDVLIPSAQVPATDSISITMVKFGIRRVAAAPPVTVKFYYTPVDDTASMYDNFITIPPTLIGSINFPANTGASETSIVSLGDSVNALFRVKSDTDNLYGGFQTMFFGLSFSDTSGLYGWRLTVPGDPQGENDDAMWINDVDDAQPRYVSYFGGDPVASFYLQVFGKGFTTVPVTLSQFNARRSGKINVLNWSTQQELNTHYFAVERSGDGRNYTSIGQVNAAGNSSGVHNYTFTDNHPANGVNYYRLRTIDKDNLSKLSPIRSIRNTGLADVHIYPNPVTDKLSVLVNADKPTTGFMTISDVGGKVVYSSSVKLPQGNTLLPVNVNNISSGSYIMKIQLDDDIIVKKFSKQ